MEKLFNLYKQVLIAHIQTKTTDSLFHERSQDFYETLFEVFHAISEKRQDTEEDESGDCKTLTEQTYDNLEEAKSIVEDMVGDNNSIWMDNLLRGLVDKLEFQCWNARALLKEETEEKDFPKSIKLPK